MDISELESKIAILKQEHMEYAKTAQSDIDELQKSVMQKVRSHQKFIDALEGKIAGYEELLAGLKSPAVAVDPPVEVK